ncbi:hypothetical protein ACLEJW_21880 [Pseudomonas sp. SMSB3]|uniref:hypothetical protein n=1 Tax=Pseudomonas sp. SMSB3 TaxID=3390196 RepID=UPI003F82F572
MRKILFLILFTTLAACGNSSMDNEIIIRSSLNGNIENTLSSSTASFDKYCNSSLCFYDFDVPAENVNKATVFLTSSGSALVFNDVTSAVFITHNGSLITDTNIILDGVAEDSRHAEAAIYFYETLDKLKAAGWQRYIFPGEARIPGAEAKKFNHFDEVLGVPVGTGPWKDPALKLNQTDWLAMPTINSWYFHKNGNYLQLRAQRKNSRQAPQERGTYLFSLNFQTEAEFYKSFVESDDREQWTTLLPSELNRMAQERAQTEARLKKMGIAIDEDYQDPPIKALE